MTNIVQMSKGGTKFYPQTHVQAVLGLPDFSSFQKASDVQTAITNAISPLQTQVNNSAVGTNLLKNTGISSTSTTTAWGTLFNSSQIYDSGIKSLSGVSAMTFSFDVYIPSNAEVGSNIPIQIKGQNSKAIDIMSDDYNTFISWPNYVIKQNDLGKTICTSYQILKDDNYQSFDTALADTASITIRQSSSASGFVYSNVKLEKGSVATDWCPNPSEIATNAGVQTAITTAVSDFKTQINDSIAGTNLLLKTDVPFSITGNNTASQFQQMYALSRRLEAGTKIIVSYDAVSTASANFTLQINGSNGGAKVGTISGTVDTTNSHYIATINPDGLSDLSINMLLDNVPSTTTITISNMTLQLKTAISSALSDVNASQTMNDSTRTKLQNMNKEMGS